MKGKIFGLGGEAEKEKSASKTTMK